MKKFACLAVLVVSAAAFAVPSATVTSFAKDADDSKRMKVVYTLSEKAVVTAEMFRGAGVGKTKLAGWFDGDVNRLLESGTRTLYWRPADEVAGTFGAGELKVNLSVYDPEDPPLYMAVFLPDTAKPAFYYASVDDIPGGATNNIYKSDYLLMRRIPAKGQTSRSVTLEADFYLGVYEVTMGQHQTMIGAPGNLAVQATGSGSPKFVCAASPIPCAYSSIRGSDYPENPREVEFADAWFLTKYRTRYGIDFDLPFEAEWEFAARAGETGTIWAGMTVDEVAWYLDNAGCETWTYGNASYTHSQRPVGLKKPNPWGLYDILGNMGEWCLDKYGDNKHVVRGSTFAGAASNLTLEKRSGWNHGYWDMGLEGSGYSKEQIGYRLYAPAKAVK